MTVCHLFSVFFREKNKSDGLMVNQPSLHSITEPTWDSRRWRFGRGSPVETPPAREALLDARNCRFTEEKSNKQNPSQKLLFSKAKKYKQIARSSQTQGLPKTFCLAAGRFEVPSSSLQLRGCSNAVFVKMVGPLTAQRPCEDAKA